MRLHTWGPGRGRFETLNRLLHTDRLVPPMIVLATLVAGLGLVCPAQTRAEQSADGALRVETLRIARADAYEVDRVYGGEVRARRTSTLGFRASGALRDVHVDEGDRVAAGTLLAALDPQPLEAARDQARAQVAHAEANLAVARAGEELATATDRRFANLLERGHASEQSYDEARLDLAGRRAGLDVARAELLRAEANLRAVEVDLADASLEAPFDARVQTRFADEGTILVPGQPVLRLVEAGAAEARIGVPTDVAAGLAEGAVHRFRAGSREVEGTLRHVLPEVDGRTRTVTALFDLAATDLPAGSVIELRLTRTVPADGFWVPITALSEAQRGLWSVYVVGRRDAGRFADRRLVEVIHTTPERVFVQGTLADGDLVVATGSQHLVPGQAVALAGPGADAPASAGASAGAGAAGR